MTSEVIRDKIETYSKIIINGLNSKIDVKAALKWITVVIGIYVADCAIIGSAAASITNAIRNATASYKGTPITDVVGASWFLTHPFKTAWSFLCHFFGAEIAYPHVYKMWIFLNVFVVIAAGIAYAGRKLKKKPEEPGSAKFAQPGDVKDYLHFKYGPGLMFGTLNNKPAILKPEAPGNRNVAVFGPPGAMKSAGYIRNNLFQAVETGQSVVVTDPKGELCRDFSYWFQSKGYTVKIFNLVSMLNSDRWNPLSEVYDDISAQYFCNVVMANTTAPGRKADPFWDNAETNLLKALVMFIIHELPPNNRNLGELYNLLASGDSKQLNSLFATLPDDHPARMPFNLFCEASGQVRTGVIMGLGNRLSVFQNKIVRELTSVYASGEGIDLELPGKERCAYFCILSDMDSTFNFLASLYFSFLFARLTRLADRQPSGRLEVPVNFLLDEFCNISGIPDFTKKLSTMRGRGIACSIIFQNVPQLEQYYPNRTWEIILGDCDYWLLLGAKELATAKYMSDVLGNSTIEIEQKTRKKGLKGLNPLDGSIKSGPQKRQLMDASEVSRLKTDESILRLVDGRVIILKKMFFKNHPWFSQLVESHIEDYIPDWSRQFFTPAATEPTEPPDDSELSSLEFIDEDEDPVSDESPQGFWPSQ